MKWKKIAIGLLFLCSLAIDGKAQSVLQSGVLGSGGGISTANGITMYATLGQATIGRTMKEKIASIGFWYLRRFPAAVPVDQVPTSVKGSFDISAGYPNPFSDRSSFQIRLPRPGRLLVRVYDLYGRIVQTLIDREEGAGVVSIFLLSAGLESGRYFIHAMLDNEPRISNIIIIK